MQKAFHAGEWADALNARVDVAKYHSACALAENYFVDYRGGLSTRPGSKYIIQCLDSENNVRGIPFQASSTVGYGLEVGHLYMRFVNDGAMVLEDALDITDASQTDPVVIEVVGNDFVVGDIIFVQSVGGMTQLNGKYFRVNAVAGDDVSLGALLDEADLDGTGYNAYTAGGTVARVYTIVSPYESDDIATLKFTQDVDKMIITHPDYVPYVLTLITANEWTLLPIPFGAQIQEPGNVAGATTLGAGTVNYAYVVTAVNASGEESGPSSVAHIADKLDLRTVTRTDRPP